jgi:DNA-binding MarR family transcriptional regulator
MKNPALATAVRTIVSKMMKRLKKEIHLPGNLSLTEVTVLASLYHDGPQFPSEMAGKVKITAQSMSQIINRLEGLNLISKTPSETDKRKVSISLSDTGKEMVERTRYERDEWLDNAIERHLSGAEKKILQQAMVLLDRLTESD